MKPSRQSQQMGCGQKEKSSILCSSLALCLLASIICCAHCEPNAASSAVAAAPKGAAKESGRVTSQSSSSSSSEAQTRGVGERDNLALPSTQAIRSVSRQQPSTAIAAAAAVARPKQQQQQPIQSAASIANAKVQNAANDMQSSAGHNYGKSSGGHGKYYMYAESPKKGSYKAGFKRGNHKHMIERKEWQHKSHAGGYMKWSGKKGKGAHKWEFKHHDKKGKHY